MRIVSRGGAALALCLAASLAAPAMAAADENTRVHYSLAESGPRLAPLKLLVLAPQIDVHELSAGGVTQKVPDLTRQANQHFGAILGQVLAGRTDLGTVPMPRLSDDEQDELEDLVATFDVVAAEGFANTRPGLAGWEDRAARFDYTLGYGLPWLRERTGADSLLVTFGIDYQSTGGRKAMTVLGAMVGIGLPTGFARVRCDLIDLATGDILWLHSEGIRSGNLTDEATMREVVEKTFASLPRPGAQR